MPGDAISICRAEENEQPFSPIIKRMILAASVFSSPNLQHQISCALSWSRITCNYIWSQCGASLFDLIKAAGSFCRSFLQHHHRDSFLHYQKYIWPEHWDENMFLLFILLHFLHKWEVIGMSDLQSCCWSLCLFKSWLYLMQGIYSNYLFCINAGTDNGL